MLDLWVLIQISSNFSFPSYFFETAGCPFHVPRRGPVERFQGSIWVSGMVVCSPLSSCWFEGKSFSWHLGFSPLFWCSRKLQVVSARGLWQCCRREPRPPMILGGGGEAWAVGKGPLPQGWKPQGQLTSGTQFCIPGVGLGKEEASN